MTIFIGLDGEMTGNDIHNSAKLIQIGLTIRDDTGFHTFTQGIRPSGDIEDGWQAEAQRVHGLTQHEVDLFPNQYQVDNFAVQWLIGRGATYQNRMKNVAVGFNVAGFDMPFVKQHLPKTFDLLSYRTVDLNAILFALSGVGKVGSSYEAWKKKAKAYAVEQLKSRGPAQAHNAGWDSAMHLYCFEYLQGVLKGLEN